MPSCLARALGITATIMIGTSAMASDQTDEQVLEEIWRSPGDSTPLFSELFLQQIPPDRLEASLREMIERCGELATIQRSGQAGEFTLVTERCEIPTVIKRFADGKINRLSLYQPVIRNVSLDDLLAKIAVFDGMVSYTVFENGNLIAEHDADRPMAVGSAFKLIVLAALVDRIDAGEASFTDVVTLKEKHVSLPSGRLQNMPIGSPFTLHTLAAAMIAESDNTATDVLIDFLGRDRLEAISGLQPFLTTREMWQLKIEDVYQRYEKADLAGRYAILDGLSDAPLPPPAKASTLWQAEAEWLLSTRSLCDWIDKVAHLDLTRINPGVVRPAEGEQVAFKGGSETGVLNLTTRVRDADGRVHCMSATWNADHPIDMNPLSGLYAAVFHALKERP